MAKYDSLRLGVLLLIGMALGGRRGMAREDFGVELYAPHDLYAAREDKPDPIFGAPDDSSGTLPRETDIDELFAQLTGAIERGEVSAAFRLAARICTLDSDHASARRVLGYARVNQQWCGGYAELMFQRGFLWHREFGWIRQQDLSHWETGSRPWGKRWVDAEEDVRRHEKIAGGWTLRTDHFQVTTNHSRAAAIDLAVRLERLYQLWRQLFGEFAASSRELEARLAGKQPHGHRRKPFRVIYHRSRAQYNDELRHRQPQIDKTLGIYFDREREAHFFAGDDQDPGTINHEAVHQFFYESRPTGRHLAALANAWATEGAACYFESLRPSGAQSFTIGAPDAGRLPAARHRRLVDGYYVPLAELSALGMSDLQQRTDLPRAYSQAAGLATFFMQYESGKYRSCFRELLAAVYAARDDASTLQNACGEPFTGLDREYRSYLEALPANAAR